ncbi:MAG: ABC transporter permease [Thermoplasmata archaeon]|jgi:ABC-2 type transport system permease protein
MKKINMILSSILVNAIYAMINYPVLLINTLLSPISILAVVTFASRGTLLPIASLGALMMNMITSGVSLQGDLSHLKNDMKLQDMVVSSPTDQKIYLLGMAISEIVYAIPTLSILLFINILFVKINYIGWILIIADMILVFSFSISLGFFLSTISSDVVQSWAFSGIISPILSTIPPVYYPITFIPYPWRYLAYVSPTTYAAEIAQDIVGYIKLSNFEFLLSWIILISFTLFTFYLGLKRSHWREP